MEQELDLQIRDLPGLVWDVAKMHMLITGTVLFCLGLFTL